MTDQCNYEQDAQVQAIVKATPGIVKDAESLNIETAENQTIAVQVLGTIKDNLKLIEDKRKFYTVPVNDILRGINNFFKKISGPLKNAEVIIKNSMRDYERRLQEEKRKAEERNRKRMERAVEKKKSIPIMTAPHVDKSVKSQTGERTVTYKDNWIGEVVDKKKFVDYCVANDRLELLDVNYSELKALAKSIKDSREIPGILIRNDKIVATR